MNLYQIHIIGTDVVRNIKASTEDKAIKRFGIVTHIYPERRYLKVKKI